MEKAKEVYSKKYTVVANDLDDLNHVNNVRFVQLIQDLAKEHWQVRATNQLKDKFIWVLVRHEIEYKKEAFLNDELLLETYVGETTFVTSKRYVNIKNTKTGAVIVSAKAVWCLLDAATKRPAKLTNELKNIFHKSSS